MEVNGWSVVLAALVVFVASRVQKLYRGIQAAGGLPGLRIPFMPYGIPGAIFKTYWWNLGLEGVWYWKAFLYKQYACETISIIPFVAGRPAILTANIEVAKQILAGSTKSKFEKMDLSRSGPIGYWGANLLLSDGDLWKKHRRIVGPAFSQKLYELVWSESLDLYKQMLSAEGYEDKKVVNISEAQQITFKFAFCIIGRCGFDFPFNWGESIESADGKVSFTEAMRYFIDNIQLLNLPQPVLDLPTAKFNKLKLCLDEIRTFMSKKISEKEAELKSRQLGNDIFSILVQANQAEEDSKLKLDYAELTSDIFLMLFAGHETTAHTLAATLACLAMFPDQQQEIVDEIMAVVGTDRDPTFDEYGRLPKVLAAFYEALRMFPTAFISIRDVQEDTVLKVPISLDGDEYTTILILKDTQVVVDNVGINYNPRYFEEPELYKPSRWYNISNESDAFPAFGLGPRACIGRKFATSEAVCFITMILRDWKIEPLLSQGENADIWFQKISKCSALVTLGVDKVPIRLIRRS